MNNPVLSQPSRLAIPLTTAETLQRSSAPYQFGQADLESDAFALGRISARWPTKSIEREFRAAYSVIEQFGADAFREYHEKSAPFWPQCLPPKALPKTSHDQEKETLRIINGVLASRAFRYLARELEWQLEDMYSNQMFTLIPSEYNMQQLIDAMSESERRSTVSSGSSSVNALVVGKVLPNGGKLDRLCINKFRDIDAHEIARSIPQLHNNQSCADVTQMIEAYLVLAKNSGLTDEERALNYLLVYGTRFYEKMYKQRNQSYNQSVHLVNIDARIQYVGERTLVCVIFNFQDSKSSAIESWSSTVDVTDTFPFLVSALEPYINVF